MMKIDDMLRFLFAAVAEAFTAYQLFKNFLYSKKLSKAKFLTNTFILVASLFIVSLFRMYAINTLLAILLLFCYAKVNFTCSSKQAICWTTVFVMLGMVAEAAVGFLVCAIYNVSISDLLNRSFEQTLIFIAGKSIALLLVKLINSLFPNKKQELKKNTLILLTFPVCAIINEFLLLYLSLNYTIERSVMFWYAIFDFCLIAAGFSIVVVYNNAIEKIELEQQLALKECKEKTNELYLSTQEKTMAELRAVLHDYKNQLRSIQSLCSSLPQAEKQCDILMDRLQKQSNHLLIDVNNISLSNLLYYTQACCEQSDIVFNLQLNFADFKFLEPLDVSTIFDNAFDNAIRACNERHAPLKKEINLYTQKTAGFILIKLTNTFNVEMLHQKDGELISTKANSNTHGFGIKNIMKAAEAYGGGVSYDIENDVFNLYVRLKQ